jgi:hypothetical protein
MTADLCQGHVGSFLHSYLLPPLAVYVKRRIWSLQNESHVHVTKITASSILIVLAPLRKSEQKAI